MKRRNFLKGVAALAVAPLSVLAEPKQVPIYFDNLIDVNTGKTLVIMTDRNAAIWKDGKWTLK